MKSMFHVIVLWLVLAALPFQGLASASMLMCGAAKPVAQAGHDHAAMQASGQHHRNGDAGGHCCGSGMGDCCVGGALAYALPQAATQPLRAERLRLPEPVPPSPVDLALPKRPPRAILA